MNETRTLSHGQQTATIASSQIGRNAIGPTISITEIEFMQVIVVNLSYLCSGVSYLDFSRCIFLGVVSGYWRIWIVWRTFHRQSFVPLQNFLTQMPMPIEIG